MTIAEKKKVYVGIDGGGSKTDIAVCASDRKELFRIRREGCNPTVCGMERTLQILKEGLSSLPLDPLSVAGVFAGIAGCPDPARRAAVKDALRLMFPDAEVDADADVINVIYCTEHRNKCVAAICGTGSVAFAKNGAALFRVGGWGPVFDRAGSGYDIGRDAVRAALAEEDGMGERTVLTSVLKELFGGSVFDGAASLPSNEPARIAAFAPIVFRVEKEGDAVAADILKNNFSRLAFLINFAAERYDCAPHVLLAGGITNEEESLDRYLRPRLNKGLALTIVREAPVNGALNAALSLCTHG